MKRITQLTILAVAGFCLLSSLLFASVPTPPPTSPPPTPWELPDITPGGYVVFNIRILTSTNLLAGWTVETVPVLVKADAKQKFFRFLETAD